MCGHRQEIDWLERSFSFFTWIFALGREFWGMLRAASVTWEQQHNALYSTALWYRDEQTSIKPNLRHRTCQVMTFV